MFGFFLCGRFEAVLLEASLLLVVYRIYSRTAGKEKKNRILINILFILFVCTSRNGLNLASLTSLVCWHQVQPFVLLTFHCGCFRSQRAHPSRKKKKNRAMRTLANPFYFSFSLRNNILHEHKYSGRFLACTIICSNLERKPECTTSAVSVYTSIY